jgi:MFS family permease
MAVATLLGAPALVLLAFTQPLPIYVVALVLCGVTTGMGYSLGQLAVQSVLPPERSAEGSSVLLTLLISIGGISVVAAAAVVEAVGNQQVTTAGIATVLVAVAALLLVSGLVTLGTEARRLRSSTQAAPTLPG